VGPVAMNYVWMRVEWGHSRRSTFVRHGDASA
jgi:hypothetical protein